MIASFIVSLMLIGLSGLLLDMHRRSWREAEEDGSLTPSDLRFARSQYKRRMQASSIIGIVGAVIGVAPLVPHEPMAFTLYLATIAAACMAITLLAALDAWATRQNFVRMRSEQQAAQIKLARELTHDSRRLNDG